jgi:hypothetical protein
MMSNVEFQKRMANLRALRAKIEARSKAHRTIMTSVNPEILKEVARQQARKLIAVTFRL